MGSRIVRKKINVTWDRNKKTIKNPADNKGFAKLALTVVYGHNNRQSE